MTMELSQQNLDDFPYLAVVNRLPANFRKIRALLKHHEGFSPTAYQDTVGKTTVGYGRNIMDNGLSASECLLLLDDDIVFHYQQLSNLLHNWDELNEARQTALISMSYNLGFIGFKKFENMIHFLNEKDFEMAATAMLESKWAEQVGKRAMDLARIIESGELDTEV